MKAKAVLTGYRSYVAANPTASFSGEEPDVALVYGEDQYKLDFRRGIIKLAGVPGALEVPGLAGWNSGPIEWVGDLVQYEHHQLVFGRGDPWSLAGQLLLPFKHGVIRAVPLLVALGAERA